MPYRKYASRRRLNDEEEVSPTKHVIDIQTSYDSDRPDKKLTVESFHNHIYFYSEIDSDRTLALIQEIQAVDEWLRSDFITHRLDKIDYPEIPIWLHIHSPGGDLLSGLALMDFIDRIDTPIYSIVEGYCASAATLLSMSCDRRFITPNSFFLIHQLTSLAYGTYEQFKDEMGLQDMMMDKLVSFYSRRSKMTPDDIRRVLQRDFWMNAEKAVEYGFVDEIY